MEEKKEKKQIKITLEVAIFIAILVIAIIISAVLIIMNKNKNDQSKLTSNNTENKIENIIEENQVETNIVNNTVESKVDDIKQELPKDKQEVIKEAQKNEEKEKETIKEEEKLPQQIEKPNETEKQQDTELFEAHFIEGITISYPNNWYAHRDAGYYEISNIEDDNFRVMIYKEKRFIDYPVPEGDIIGSRYGSLYYYLYKFVNDGLNEANYITDYLEELVLLGNVSNLGIEGRAIWNEFWGIISYTTLSGDGLSMYCEKNGWLYAIDIIGISDSNKDNVDKMVNSIMLAEG